MKVTKSIIEKQRVTYYHNNKEHVLEYQKNRYNDLSKKKKDERAIYAKNWYNNLPEDKKNIKRAYARNKYHSMPYDKMLEFKTYQKKYQKIQRNEKGTR